MLEFDYGLVRAFYDRSAYWQRFGRLNAERLYVKKARREAALLMDPPLARYEAFLREYGADAERIRGYHVASYLGITPEALSRLRKSRRRPTQRAARSS